MSIKRIRPPGYWKARGEKRRQDPTYREAQKALCKKWREKNGKEPKRLARKAELMREYLKDPEKRMKYKSRMTLHLAIASGKIKKQPCCRCQASKAEAHHPDYSKPLEIIWLCRPCHINEHAKSTIPRIEMSLDQ